MLLLGMVWSSLHAQSSETPIDRWFTIKEKRIVPVTSLRDHTLAYLNLDGLSANDSIKICHGSEIDLWINNQLYYRKLPKGCEKYLKADLIKFAGTDSVTLSVSYERYADLQAFLIADNGESNGTQLQVRSRNLLSHFYLLALMVILIMTAILKYVFPNKFSWLMSNPLASRSSLDQDELYTGFWHLENLFTSLIFSLFVSLQIIYLHQELNVWSYLNTWNDQYVTQWLFIAGLIFGLLFAKYIYSWLMSRLLQARILPNIQFQDFIQIFIWLSFVIIGLFFIDLYLIPDTRLVLADLAYLLLIGGLIAFQLWLYFKFVKYYSHKKLLIISYLCTTEILPVFLIIFWLVK